MRLTTTQQEAIRHLRDEGIIPEATAGAFLPAKRRKVARCRNHRGSAYLDGGPCTEAVARVRVLGIDGQEIKGAGFTLCPRCLADEGHLFTDGYRVDVVGEVPA